MRGRIAAREGARELAMFGAWQGERFAREERLKGFGHYAREVRRATKDAQKAQTGSRAQEMLASFLAIRNSGVPVSIRRLNRCRT